MQSVCVKQISFKLHISNVVVECFSFIAYDLPTSLQNPSALQAQLCRSTFASFLDIFTFKHDSSEVCQGNVSCGMLIFGVQPKWLSLCWLLLFFLLSFDAVYLSKPAASSALAYHVKFKRIWFRFRFYWLPLCLPVLSVRVELWFRGKANWF